MLAVTACSHCACLSAAGASEQTVQQVQGMLEVAWAGAIQPLVMGLAGASIHFASLPPGTALKALALTAIGESALQLLLWMLYLHLSIRCISISI